MERRQAGLAASVLSLALALSAAGCSASRPPATSPDERPDPRQPHPAVRLDGGGAAQPAPARTRPAEDSGFEHGTVREESLKTDDAAAETEESTDADSDAGSGAAPTELRHVLQRGQTLYSVSRMYGVSLEALLQANGIHDARKVAAGTPLLIPLARPERNAAAEPHAGTGAAVHKAKRPEFRWPIEGAITGPFGPRGKHSHHEGIDIDGSDGDPIQAAASGTVAFAGSNGDYGRCVIIDHGDGLRTLYGHASKLLVKEGEEIHAGDVIAAVGHSGNARGSHLHFEVRRDGRPVNPLPYLLPPDVLTAGAVALPHTTTKSASRRH